MGVEAWLAKGAAEGVYDSTSDFTIDSVKAMNKLSKHQLPGRGLWLVKLVQAAVVLEATEMKVTLGRQVVRFQCRFPTLPCEPEQLLQDFLSGALPEDSFRLHWVTGMRGSLGEDTLDSELSVESGAQRFQVKIHDSGTDVEQGESTTDGDCLLDFKTKRPPVWPSFGRALALPMKYLFRRVADEYIALQNYCWPVGSRLIVDGRPLEQRYRPSPQLQREGLDDWSADFTNSSPLGTLPSMLLVRSLPLASSGAGEGFHWEPTMDDSPMELDHADKVTLAPECYSGECWMRWKPREQLVNDAKLFLLVGGELDSRIEFLWDGAIIDTFPLPWQSSRMTLGGKRLPQNQGKLGLRIVVPIGRGSVDVSQFKVREVDSLVEELLPNLENDVKESLLLTKENLKERRGYGLPRDSRTSTKFLMKMMAAGPVRQVMQSNIRSEIESFEKSLDINRL